MYQLIVNRKDFHDFRISKTTPKSIEDGQILLKINQFAFTSNNITYAAVGEKVGYWNFFPVSEEEGIIPVWGFADVVESKSEEIIVGERFYGYYPMASHVVLLPTEIKNGNFTDGSSHRTSLPPIYNHYVNTKSDPGYSVEGEAFQSIFRPLFTTSFLIEDLFFDNNFFGSKNIILTSASSKTATGLAFLLNQRKAEHDINIIGLTSSEHKEFVTKLGFYDEVYTYDSLDKIELEKSSIVDFSGNNQTQSELQEKLGDHLLYNCLVGMVDWQNRGKAAANGIFFFAPTQANKRMKDWGPKVFQEKLSKAWISFTQNAENWMTIKETTTTEALSDLYIKMLDGNVDPSVGHIVKI
ncbi:MAG TPA: DUF2855 family protein [Chitinophagales bacterium]|nr:DUF2855 family protein [Chitinophagales bacterium]